MTPALSHRFHVSLSTLATCACLFQAGCGSTASVRHHPPPPPPVISEAVTRDQQEAVRLARSNPTASLAAALDAVRVLDQDLATGRPSPQTVAAYNHAVGRVVEAIERAGIDPWRQSVTLTADSGPLTLKAGLEQHSIPIDPSRFRFIPTDTVETSGRYFTTMVTEKGIGAPLAVVIKQPGHTIKHDLHESSVYGCATAVISFRGRNAELTLYETLRADSTALHGHRYPLAADFSTPLALMMAEGQIEKLGLARLFSPERYAETARLTRLQLYDPDRIPVLMVHGLDSTPATWTPMINELRADPELRRRYQFWVFSYPSGYPYPYSATLLRKELDKIDAQHPGHKPIVLIGHSMGGIISRLMLTDSGDHLWRAFFGKPPAETHLPGFYRQELEASLVFRHRTDIGRTIFISAPHRGSEIATSRIGRLASRLVRVPTFMADVRDAVISAVTVDATALTLERAPNSIDTLSPNNRFVKAVNQLPLTRGIPFHSIMGDRGRGDTPHSSDGVVPYWSSHLDGAVSEKIVPSDHGAHQNPEGIQEVRRILRLNAGLPPPPAKPAAPTSSRGS